MDDSHILRIIPSKRLREYLYNCLPECNNLPEAIRQLKLVHPNVQTNLLITVYDIKWLHTYIEAFGTSDDLVQFFELMEGIQILIPGPEPVVRNSELEARILRLRAEQSQRDYRSMTKNVDCVRYREPEESIGAQIKAINRQLIAVAQFVISVGAGFLFGFTGVELMVGDLDFGFRLLLGVMVALIIALAEIYFLAKKLNEDLFVPGEYINDADGLGVDEMKHHQE